MEGGEKEIRGRARHVLPDGSWNPTGEGRIDVESWPGDGRRATKTCSNRDGSWNPTGEGGIDVESWPGDGRRENKNWL